VTIARTVSERFFLVLSHATCSGVSQTLTRSVFRSAMSPSTLADFMLPVAKLKILVVEDDDTVRRLLADHLAEMMAVDVDSARDGIDALHKISTTAYGVIILDLMMPKMTGVDLLDSMRALSSDPSVKSLETPPPVLVITAAPAAGLSDAVIRKRYPDVVRAVFRKPLDVAALVASVQKHLRYDPPRR
jgi:CheY-like chemotaxis protein